MGLDSSKLTFFKKASGQEAELKCLSYLTVEGKAKRNTGTDGRVDYTAVFKNLNTDFQEEIKKVCKSIGGGGYHRPETLLKALHEGRGKTTVPIGASQRLERKDVRIREAPSSLEELRNVRRRLA